jgi:23S rRNA (uracil1939-C5)-methyltransferase
MDALAARQFPTLVYISGDPATLARDAKRLVGHGYRLDSIQPIDLSPQTYFIDSVCRFSFGTHN